VKEKATKYSSHSLHYPSECASEPREIPVKAPHRSQINSKCN